MVSERREAGQLCGRYYTPAAGRPAVTGRFALRDLSRAGRPAARPSSKRAPSHVACRGRPGARATRNAGLAAWRGSRTGRPRGEGGVAVGPPKLPAWTGSRCHPTGRRARQVADAGARPDRWGDRRRVSMDDNAGGRQGLALVASTWEPGSLALQQGTVKRCPYPAPTRPRRLGTLPLCVADSTSPCPCSLEARHARHAPWHSRPAGTGSHSRDRIRQDLRLSVMASTCRRVTMS